MLSKSLVCSAIVLASLLLFALSLPADEPRSNLLPKLRDHLTKLAGEEDRIDAPHRAGGKSLAEWLAANYQPGMPLHVLVICTGNSRRSMLAASLGNAAASYYGLPEIRFHSGGTAESAFNSRTIATLKAIGFEIHPTGEEAKRGAGDGPNPKYLVRWGKEGAGLETTEFSKHYTDAANPQKDFAAILVCGEADKECPVVPGAAKRISMPYADPKAFDGTPEESARYAERRDDIGRLMMGVLRQVREKLK